MIVTCMDDLPDTYIRVPSPCISVCVLDQPTGLCTGCGRNGLEIAVWLTASDVEKRSILEQLPARLKWLAARKNE
jgi:predicted Fe-S protein YdhL (DUF1289 family)